MTYRFCVLDLLIMKRINPKTKLPFKMGDKRNDGYIFVNYATKIRKQGPFKGFYKEGFYSPKKFEKFKEESRIRAKERFKKNPSRKGKKTINPATGKPWKYGEINTKTGRIFQYYKTSFIKPNGYFPESWLTFNTLHRMKIRIAANRRKKDYPKNFKVNKNYLLKIFPKNFICPVLKIKMSWGGNIQTSPSLDRINNKKGYTKDNVCWISYRANSIKCDASYDQIIKVGKWLKSKGY